jgi:GGDEF domain-containing protein
MEQPVTSAAAENLAERILADVRGSHTVNGQPAVLSASIGLVVCPAAGMLPDDLMRTAEAAMHAAKSQGRDRWVRMDAPAGDTIVNVGP